MSDPFATLCPTENFGAVETRLFCRVPMGRLRRTALKSVILSWDEWATPAQLKARARRRFARDAKDDGYGIGVIAAFVLAAIASECIAFAVEKLLQWLFPDKSESECDADPAKTAEIYRWQQYIRGF